MALAESYRWTKEFQRALTRFVLEDPMKGGRILRELQPERFPTEVAQRVFAIARAYAEDHSWQAPTPAEIRQLATSKKNDGDLDADEVKDIYDYLSRCKSSNGIGRDMLMDEVMKVIRDQALRVGLDDAIRAMGEGKTELAFKKLELASHVGRDLINSTRDVHLPDDLESVLKSVQTRSQGRRAISPIAELDRYMRGGAGGGEMAIIMGVAGSGKSTYLCDLSSCNLAEGNASVYHCSLELSEKDVVTKATGNLMDMTLEEVESGKIPYSKLQVMMTEYLKERGSTFIVRHAPPRGMMVKDIAQHLRALRVERNFHPTLIVVDYADILAGSSSGQNSYTEQGEIYGDLKALAIELDVPVWTASQARRDAVDQTRLFMSEVAESFRKAHLADFLISIGAAEEDKSNQMARLYIAKNRYGKSGVEIGPFPQDFEKGRFIMLGDDTNNPNAEIAVEETP